MFEKDEIEAVQNDRIQEVVDKTGVSHDLSSALLMKNSWVAQRAIDALIKDDYLMNEFKFTLEEGEERIQANEDEEEFCCDCCYDTAEPSEIIEMPDCGHRLCAGCFSEYCKTKLAQGQEVVSAKCPDAKCGNIVS